MTAPLYSRQDLHLRAAAYYAQLRPPQDTWQSIEDLEPVILEFEHQVQAKNYNRAAQIIDLVDDDYLMPWGHARRIIEMRQMLPMSALDEENLLNNLVRLANAYIFIGQYEHAKVVIEQGLDHARAAQNSQKEGVLTGLLGITLHESGYLDEAHQHYQAALEKARAAQDKKSEVEWLGQIGNIHLNQARFEEGRHSYEEAIEIAKEIGDIRQQAYWSGSLGTYSYEVDAYDKAIEYLASAIEVFREIQDRVSEGRRLTVLGRAYLAIGRVLDAIKSFQAGLAIAIESDRHREAGKAFLRLGTAYHMLGDYELALRQYQQGLELATQVGDRRHTAVHMYCMGRAYYAMRDFHQASKYLEEGYQRSKALQVDEVVMESAYALGLLLLSKNEWDRALQLTEDALAYNYLALTPSIHIVRAIAYLRTDRPQEARMSFEAVITTSEQILERCDKVFDAMYAQAFAYAGLALLSDLSDKQLLEQAQTTYRRALDNCATRGVVEDALRLLAEMNDAENALSQVRAVLEAAQ